jgi:hypothetical protein
MDKMNSHHLCTHLYSRLFLAWLLVWLLSCSYKKYYALLRIHAVKASIGAIVLIIIKLFSWIGFSWFMIFFLLKPFLVQPFEINLHLDQFGHVETRNQKWIPAKGADSCVEQVNLDCNSPKNQKLTGLSRFNASFTWPCKLLVFFLKKFRTR